MGLGFTITAPILPEGFFSKKVPSHQEVLGRIQAAIPAIMGESPLTELLWMAEEGDSLLVGLHPIEEPLRFSFTPEGALRCQARTHCAGPGYHAFVVEVLQKIAPKCKLKWEESADDTGYFTTRDFAKTQAAMLQWLQQQAQDVAARTPDSAAGMKISLPLEFPALEGESTVMTLLGPREQAWFAQVAQAEGDALQAAGAEFFPWWTRKPDAAFWSKTGTALAWVELPWHAPADEREDAFYALAQFCFERARAADPTGTSPAEIAEIAALKADATRTLTPAESGIGYFRRPLRFQLSGGWSIALPGYFYQATKDDGRQFEFTFGKREVYISTLSVASRSENASFEERLLQSLIAKSVDGQLLKTQQGVLIGRAAIMHSEEDGEDSWALSGYMAASNNLAMITVVFDGEADKEWALNIWQTLKHPESGE